MDFGDNAMFRIRSRNKVFTMPLRPVQVEPMHAVEGEVSDQPQPGGPPTENKEGEEEGELK